MSNLAEKIRVNKRVCAIYPESRGPAYGAIYSLYKILDSAIYFHPGVHHAMLHVEKRRGLEVD